LALHKRFFVEEKYSLD